MKYTNIHRRMFFFYNNHRKIIFFRFIIITKKNKLFLELHFLNIENVLPYNNE